MDLLGQRLDARGDQLTAEDSRRAAEAWQISGRAPEERLLAFDHWIRLELAARLEWGWAGEQRERRIEQCRILLEQLVLDLWRRGWMLDGRRLAKHLETVLDRIGAYQRAGKVQDFWSYFSACVSRYVGSNAEEIQAEAMRAGAHVGQLLGALGITRGPQEPALPALLAQRADEIGRAKDESLRAKLSRARARKAPCTGDAQQGTLADFL